MGITVTPGETCDHLVFDTPILSTVVLETLREALEAPADRTSGRPLILSSSHPRIFLAGADLAEIAELDVFSSLPYARFGRRVLALLRGYPAPTVAAVDGVCAGGGLDLVLSCDIIVAGHGATFSHPGVRRGLVTGWHGSARLPARLGESAARRALLEGRPLAAAELQCCALVLSSRDDPAGEAAALAPRLRRLHPLRLALSRMASEGAFVDSFRAFVVHNHV